MEEEGGSSSHGEQELRRHGTAGTLEAHLRLVTVNSEGKHPPAGDYSTRLNPSGACFSPQGYPAVPLSGRQTWEFRVLLRTY